MAKRCLASASSSKRESTVREDKRRLETVLKASWAKRRIDEIRTAHITRWLDRLRRAGQRGNGVSGATLNRYLSLVSVIFKHAVDLGYLDASPVAGIKRFDERGRQREEFLSTKELRALLDHCPTTLHLIVLAAASTGLRRGTLLKLRWRDVDIDAGTITVRASIAKGKRPITVRMVKALREALESVRADMKVRHLRGEDHLFLGPKGLPWNPRTLYDHFRRAVDTCAGIPVEKRRKIVFHSLRHTFASLLTIGGVHQRIVQEAMSHSVPELTARYSHLAAESMQQVVDCLESVFEPDDSTDSVHEGYLWGYQAPSGA